VEQERREWRGGDVVVGEDEDMSEGGRDMCGRLILGEDDKGGRDLSEGGRDMS
jgi:hypothetical protein